MKEKMNRLGQKILSKLLVLLGFSCTFMFMACYGPRPQEFDADMAEEYADSIAEVPEVSDSTIVNEE
jgi:hypothetical protein